MIVSGDVRVRAWLALLFSEAVRLYPRPFRERFGAAMREAFGDVLTAASTRGVTKLLGTAFRSILTCAAGGLAERFRAVSRASQVPGSRSSRRWSPSMDGLLRDFRFAFRSLLRRPGFTGIAVVTLALGIGANTAIFSVVDGVLLRPLPYTDPDGLVVVRKSLVDDPAQRSSMSLPDIEDIEALDAFETLVGIEPGDWALTGQGEARMISAASVTDGLLGTFRLTPALGRDLAAADGKQGSAAVVVISHGFWQTVLGGRADVLGSTIELEGVRREVVGVGPRGFDYPRGAELWIPWERQPGCVRGCHTLRPIGRLSAGTVVEHAQLHASALAVRLSETYPESNTNKRFVVISLEDDVVGNARTGLWILFGAVGVVLLIACANVANLLFVRATHRRGEVAVRAALGASSARLARELLSESFVLAMAGATLGVAAAAGMLAGLRNIGAATVPRIDAVALDGRVLLFTLGLSLVVALVFGSSPALRLARGALREAVTGAGRGMTRGPGERRYRASLLAGEVALSVLLLVGAGLLLRTFGALMQVPLGFDDRDVVRFTVSLPDSRYDDLEEIVGFFEELETGIAALPGVESVGSTFGAPFSSGRFAADVLIDGRPEPRPGDETGAAVRPVTAGYLETMRIPVLRGRGIADTDRISSAPVAVVNETFVRENFPGEEPLGQRFSLSVDFGFGSPTYEIVGVAADVLSSDVTGEPNAAAYVPLTHTGISFMVVHVRSRAGTPPPASQLHARIAAIDPNLPAFDLETVRDAVHRTVAPTRFYLVLIGGFAALAVILAALGLYGVVSYQVARQTREIGVRLALGARAGGVVGMVLFTGLRPAVAGVVIGLAAALAAGRIMESLLFGVRPNDPLTLAAVPALLLCVVVIASLVPALRAAHVDPVSALRSDE